MHKVGFFYDDIFLDHAMPPGHPESPDRLRAVLSALNQSPFGKAVIRCSPRKASRDEITAVHSTVYFDALRSFTGYFDPDTFVSEHSFEAALFAAGSALESVDRIRSGDFDRAFCAVRPPGHHAEKSRAMGFCLFNNVAVGARHAQKKGYAKVFIVDFDVHHGNGTQHIFEGDDSVYYFSTHQFPHYPGTGSDSERGKGTGTGFTYNIPMRHGSGDKEYMNAYQDILPDLVRRFDPDIMLVSAGYDLHAGDPLAGIRVTDEGIRNIVRGILGAKPGIPSIFCLEGGYDLGSLAESVVVTIAELLSFD